MIRWVFVWLSLSGLWLSSFATDSNPGSMRVAFADTMNGWAAGSFRTGGLARDSAKVDGRKPLYRTMILKTTDGGSRWTLQTVIQTGDEAIRVVDMHVTDAHHASIVINQPDMDRNFFLRTVNGKDWAAFPLGVDATPKKLYFLDAANGFLMVNEFVSEDRLYKTTDAGRSWHEFPIGFSGLFHDMAFVNGTGYVLANLNASSTKVTLLKSQDGGNLWFVAQEFTAEDGHQMAGRRLVAGGSDVSVMLDDWEMASEEWPQTLVVHSDDGFSSHTLSRVTYDTEKKSPFTFLRTYAYNGRMLVGVDAGTDIPPISQVIVSSDHGRTWYRSGTWPSSLTTLIDNHGGRLVASTGEGELVLSLNGGASWVRCEIDFRNTFLKPDTDRLRYSSSPISFADEMDAEDIERDTTYASRWESEADSLLAVQATSRLDPNRYRPKTNAAFSVGIDSIATTKIVFHKRIRRGAKHQMIDLIREENQIGEIRIRKYKTIRLAGSAVAAGHRRAVRYSWSSSINGDLSDQAAFTTTPRQLYPGTHYIFFKAMDDQGVWSEPVVAKVIVEDFPKYKFPFDGAWTVGGGGSYYNQGRHVRGIRYALDLNYAEGQEGGDSDYGIPVRASTDGTISFAGYVKGYGRTVKVDYMFGGHKYTTLTTHLATISVEVGEKVKQGQEIGTCGSTGRSSAPHVHWELRVDDVCAEPEPVFENDSTVVQMLRNGALFVSDNRYQPDHIIVVDEPALDNTWFEYRGYNHSYRWTNVTKNTKTVECVWRPQIKRSGLYKVQVHIPKKFATALATYRIHSKRGVVEVKVNQNKFTDEWVTLGTYELDAFDDVRVITDNATGQVRKTIALDAVRFIGMWNEHPEVGLESTPK